MSRGVQAQLKVTVQKRDEAPLVLHHQAKKGFTIGRSMSCSYTLDSALLPERHRLVVMKKGIPWLQIPVGISSELENIKTKHRLKSEDILGMGVLSSNGVVYEVPLHAHVRAILKFGETLFVLEPSHLARSIEQENPLPWELRFTPPSKDDLAFLGILVLCFATTFFSIWRILSVDLPPRMLPEEVQQRYAKLILETPVKPIELYQPPVKEPEVKAEKTPEAVKPKEAKPKQEPLSKGSTDRGGGGSGGKNLKNQGLLGQLERQGGGIAGLLQSKEMKSVLQGVGVLTTKRPSDQHIAGAPLAYRDASGLDDMVAGIAKKGGGGGSGGTGLGPGAKTSSSVGNPFEVAGSGTQHALRSYAEIDQIIRRYLQGVRFLYERYLRNDPTMKGRVTLKFSIAADGRVTQCSVVSSNMNKPEFEAELVKRVLLWRFPAIEAKAGSVSVVYPFTFLPKTQ